MTTRLLTRSRLAGLGLLLLLVSTSASAASADYFLKIDTIDGESQVVEFEIAGPGDAPVAGMLLPAIQKVRDAANRSAIMELACTGVHVPTAKLTARKNGGSGSESLVIELRDVVITSFQRRGGVRVAVGDVNGDGRGLVDSVKLTFAEAVMTSPETGEVLTLDCSSGACSCVR